MLGFVPSDPFFGVVSKVCFWIIVLLGDPNMSHYKISNSQLLLDFLSVGI